MQIIKHKKVDVHLDLISVLEREERERFGIPIF